MERPLGKRVRRDPNVRIAEEEERRSRVQLGATSARASTAGGLVPNPTRFVPEAKGFTTLTMTELKADIHAADLSTVMAVDDETEAEFPQINILIEKTVKPPCGSDSTIAKKKMRFASWIQHPLLLKADLCKYRKTVSLVEQEYNQLIAEDDALVHAMQLTRRELLSGLNVLGNECNKMHMVRNAVGDKILDLCQLYAKSDFLTLLKKKSVGSIPRDIVDEISELHFEYIDQLEKYVLKCNEVLLAAESSGKAEPPAPAPTGKRGVKRAQATPAITQFEVPVAMIELTEVEEIQARKASLNYRSRLTGVHKNDVETAPVPDQGVGKSEAIATAPATTGGDSSAEIKMELSTANDNVKDADNDGTGGSRMHTRGAAVASGKGSKCSATAVLARFTEVEEQLRFFESTSVGELVSDQFPTSDTTPGSSSSAATTEGGAPDVPVSESQCMGKLNELFFSGGSSGGSSSAKTFMESASAAVRPVAPKKKSRSTGTSSIIMTAKPLITCPRGVPLLLSSAGLHPDRCVGMASNTADGCEGASLSIIPQSMPRSDNGNVFLSAAQVASEQEDKAIIAQSLKSKIIASQVQLSLLTKDVANWKNVANDMTESLGYAKNRHLDTQQYNSADVLLIRAQLRGKADIGTVVTESESGLLRNGFLKSSNDDADFFGLKVGGKNHGGNRKSKKNAKLSRLVQNQRFSAKVPAGPGVSAIDILSSIAELEGGGSVNNDECRPSPVEEEEVVVEASIDKAGKNTAPSPTATADAPTPPGDELGKANEKQASISAKSLRSKKSL